MRVEGCCCRPCFLSPVRLTQLHSEIVAPDEVLWIDCGKDDVQICFYTYSKSTSIEHRVNKASARRNLTPTTHAKILAKFRCDYETCANPPSSPHQSFQNPPHYAGYPSLCVTHNPLNPPCLPNQYVSRFAARPGRLEWLVSRLSQSSRSEIRNTETQCAAAEEEHASQQGIGKEGSEGDEEGVSNNHPRL